MLCVVPGVPTIPAAPNSSGFEFAPQNLGYVDLFLHKGWVLMHKEEVLVIAVVMGSLHADLSLPQSFPRSC